MQNIQAISMYLSSCLVLTKFDCVTIDGEVDERQLDQQVDDQFEAEIDKLDNKVDE